MPSSPARSRPRCSRSSSGRPRWVYDGLWAGCKILERSPELLFEELDLRIRQSWVELSKARWHSKDLRSTLSEDSREPRDNVGCRQQLTPSFAAPEFRELGFRCPVSRSRSREQRRGLRSSRRG